MTNRLTPRETVEYWLDLALTTGANRQDFNMSEAVSDILTALASGSGDHAELARLAEWHSVESRKTSSGYPQAELHKSASRNIYAIIAENAALRADRDDAFQALEAEREERGIIEDRLSRRATEAERKLAEAVGLLLEACRELEEIGDGFDVSDRINTFISKEAERG